MLIRCARSVKAAGASYGVILALFTAIAPPIVATASRNPPINLSPGFNPSVRTISGYARGAIDLHKVVGDRDVNQNRCMGYGSPEPDHILVLADDFAQLTLQVDSGNQDTTLLLMGPDGRLHCADDTRTSKDAALSLALKSGEYKAWIGTIDPGQRYSYSLKIQE